MVGARRFELLTFCTPSKRATKLRYAPTEKISCTLARVSFMVNAIANTPSNSHFGL